MKTTTTGPATITFKSERAAKVAMTKAEKAYTDALINRNGAYGRAMETEGMDPLEALHAANAAVEAAAKVASNVYESARTQGFYVRSYHFGYNATRDLISANMD